MPNLTTRKMCFKKSQFGYNEELKVPTCKVNQIN